MTKDKDIPIRVSQENHRWVSNKSDDTQISNRSIIDLAIRSLRGQYDPAMELFRDKKGKTK